MMTVRDLLPMHTDIDVCDDYDESCYIAFCGPMKLTAQGEQKFAKALSLPIQIGNIVIINCGDDEEEAEENVEAAREFFYAMAGYCDADDYDRWFIEPDDDEDCDEFPQDDSYTPSATAGDYSPSNPWNAPGMSIHDFI